MVMGDRTVRSSGAGCLSLGGALFIAFLIATAGTAIYPRVSGVGAAVLCSGEVRYESHGQSYRPGEYTVTREIYCDTGSGKGVESEEITFRAVGVSFLIYAAALFLILRFVAAPLLRRRLQRSLSSPTLMSPPAALSDILAKVGEVAARQQADAQPNDVAERLTRLRELRDQGLITGEDYEAKKAEILLRI